MAPTRWGILSTGKIAFDFVNAISLLPPEDHQVVAVGARKLESAELFANEFNIPRVYGSYQEVIDDPDIDVVYVATINPMHFVQCKQLIEAGKNVLCEKPLTLNAEQAKIVLSMAKDKGVFFQEGLWSRFFPAYHKLREALISGVIGEVKVVKVGFAMSVMGAKRICNRALGGGATLDLGCYAVQFAQLVFNEYPQKIVSSGIVTLSDVDEATFSTLHYSNNRIANVYCHAGVKMSNTAEIYGTKGSIQMPYVWCPDSIVINGERHEFPLLNASKPMNFFHSEGFMYEAESVRQCLLKGMKENPLATHQDSEWNISIIDEILKQNGVNYV